MKANNYSNAFPLTAFPLHFKVCKGTKYGSYVAHPINTYENDQGIKAATIIKQTDEFAKANNEKTTKMFLKNHFSFAKFISLNAGTQNLLKTFQVCSVSPKLSFDEMNLSLILAYSNTNSTSSRNISFIFNSYLITPFKLYII